MECQVPGLQCIQLTRIHPELLVGAAHGHCQHELSLECCVATSLFTAVLKQKHAGHLWLGGSFQPPIVTEIVQFRRGFYETIWQFMFVSVCVSVRENTLIFCVLHRESVITHQNEAQFL